MRNCCEVRDHTCSAGRRGDAYWTDGIVKVCKSVASMLQDVDMIMSESWISGREFDAPLVIQGLDMGWEYVEAASMHDCCQFTPPSSTQGIKARHVTYEARLK